MEWTRVCKAVSFIDNCREWHQNAAGSLCQQMNTFGPGDQRFIQGTDVGSLMLTTTVRNFVIHVQVTNTAVFASQVRRPQCGGLILSICERTDCHMRVSIRTDGSVD